MAIGQPPSRIEINTLPLGEPLEPLESLEGGSADRRFISFDLLIFVNICQCPQADWRMVRCSRI